MNEPILKALIKLFALISDVHSSSGISSRGKDIVRLFLAHHLNNELVVKYMEMFDEYVLIYHSDNIAQRQHKGQEEDLAYLCENIGDL